MRCLRARPATQSSGITEDHAHSKQDRGSRRKDAVLSRMRWPEIAAGDDRRRIESAVTPALHRVPVCQQVIRPGHRAFATVITVDHPEGLVGGSRAARTTLIAPPASDAPPAAHLRNITPMGRPLQNAVVVGITERKQPSCRLRSSCPWRRIAALEGAFAALRLLAVNGSPTTASNDGCAGYLEPAESPREHCAVSNHLCTSSPFTLSQMANVNSARKEGRSTHGTSFSASAGARICARLLTR